MKYRKRIKCGIHIYLAYTLSDVSFSVVAEDCCICFIYHFNNQTDQGDETESLEVDGLEGKGFKEGWCEETINCLILI
jgi:hypothetical protein